MAIKPKKLEKPDPDTAPVAITAPIMMTDEIALVSPINGECRAGVTRQTT